MILLFFRFGFLALVAAISRFADFLALALLAARLAAVCTGIVFVRLCDWVAIVNPLRFPPYQPFDSTSFVLDLHVLRILVIIVALLTEP